MTDNNTPKENDAIVVNGISFTHKDIFMVVDEFYTRIQQDFVLSVPFRSVGDWPEHIKRLTHFWWIRFGGRPYMFSEYNPVLKHFFAGFNKELLERWLSIFHDTLRKKLTTEQADLWALISDRMGESLSIRNEHYRREYESKNTESRE